MVKACNCLALLALLALTTASAQEASGPDDHGNLDLDSADPWTEQDQKSWEMTEEEVKTWQLTTRDQN